MMYLMYRGPPESPYKVETSSVKIFFSETYRARVFANLSTGTDLIRSWDKIKVFLAALLRALNRDGQFLLDR